MNPNLRFTTLFALFCCFFAAIAGEEHDQFPDTVLNFNEVAVVARRQPLASAQSISGVELQKLSSTSIADALKYFAGVQIKDYGGLGGLKTINVRSLGAQHVGVYIDGVRLTNAQNGTIDLGKYSLSTLESVSLFNANRLDQCQSASEYASGATVYLQSRRPTSDSLTVLGGIGSFHSYRGRVNAQISRRTWSGFIDAEYVNSKGDYPFRYKSQWEDTVGAAVIQILSTDVSRLWFSVTTSRRTPIGISRNAVAPEALCAVSPTNTQTWPANGTRTCLCRVRGTTVSTPCTVLRPQ